MNIKEIFQSKSQQQEAKPQSYVGTFKRSTASFIDVTIVFFLRAFAMQIMGYLWLNEQILRYAQDFQNRFGTESMKNTKPHVEFLLNHQIFIHGIIFYFIVLMIGALYHSLLNSSKWQATIGKRLLKIVMVKDEFSYDEPSEIGKFRISYAKALGHYFLSILPLAYVIYITSYQVNYKLDFVKAITATEANVFFGLVFILWVQIHIFTKKKTTAYDMICKTNFVNGRTSSKFPW